MSSDALTVCLHCGLPAFQCRCEGKGPLDWLSDDPVRHYTVCPNCFERAAYGDGEPEWMNKATCASCGKSFSR